VVSLNDAQQLQRTVSRPEFGASPRRTEGKAFLQVNEVQVYWSSRWMEQGLLTRHARGGRLPFAGALSTSTQWVLPSTQGEVQSLVLPSTTASLATEVVPHSRPRRSDCGWCPTGFDARGFCGDCYPLSLLVHPHWPATAAPNGHYHNESVPTRTSLTTHEGITVCGFFMN